MQQKGELEDVENVFRRDLRRPAVRRRRRRRRRQVEAAGFRTVACQVGVAAGDDAALQDLGDLTRINFVNHRLNLDT